MLAIVQHQQKALTAQRLHHRRNLASAVGAHPDAQHRRDGRAHPSGADRALRPVTQAIGRGLVSGMPGFLKLLGLVGTAAMVWVGGGIIIHGMEEFGLAGLGHALHDAAAAAGGAMPALGGVVAWLVNAAGSGLVGLILGVAIVLVLHKALFPAIARFRSPGARQTH